MDSGSRKIEFKGAQGQTLAARLDVPVIPPRAYALFAHCFTCSKDIFAASRIAGELTAYGIAVLRFDFTGLGASEGEFANTNFSSNIADLVSAYRYLEDEHQAPKILIGHSLGGAAVLAAATDMPAVNAVTTIGAPSSPSHVKHLFQDSLDEIKGKGKADVVLAGRTFSVQMQFLEDIETHNLRKNLHDLHKPLLIFHSPLDSTVDISNAAEIYQAARHPKSFVSLDKADHLLSKRGDAAYVATVLAAWASRYLPEDSKPSCDTDQTEPGTLIVATSDEGKFTQNICVGGKHHLRADEPLSVGGLDSAPSPYDLLLAALGACTSMTIKMYADRKGINLDSVSVKLLHEKVHSTDCEECETKAGKIDQIQRWISLSGELSDEQRQRMLEIADMCPVHKTLHSEVNILTELRT